MSRIAKWWRQFWCMHEFFIEDIQKADPEIYRDPLVTCHCHKCMKLFQAEYGLALPGTFTRRPS